MLAKYSGGRVTKPSRTPGREHDAGEIRHHFLAADAHLHALFHGEADVIAPLLVERGHELVLRAAVEPEAEDEFWLDRLEILAAVARAEAEVLKHAAEILVFHGDVRVDLDDIGLIFLRQLAGGGDKLAERLAVVKIADGATAGIEHRFVDIGHGADQEGDAAPDPAVRAARDDGAPLPRGLLLGPEGALRKMSLRVALYKCLVFREGGFLNQFGHDTFSVIP